MWAALLFGRILVAQGGARPRSLVALFVFFVLFVRGATALQSLYFRLDASERHWIA